MKNKILAAIFLLALVLRFWNIGTYPEAVDEDEMALGYYGYTLFKNGTDEYGNKFPIYFESAGDFKYGLYSYFAAVPVGLFGLNAVTTRSIAAIAGALSVIAIYYLAKEIFDKEKYALASAFVLAVAPTHIHFSRVAYNNVLGALFGTLSILFLIRWLRKATSKRLLLLSLFFILSIFSYQAYRIFMPSSFFLIFLIFWRKLKKERRLKALVLVVASFAVVFLSLIPPESRARSQNFSLLINAPKLTEQFTEDSIAGSTLLTTRVFHNKVTAFTLGVAERYFSYFDPTFLFVRSTPQVERHSTPDVGLFYLIESAFFLLGLLFLFKLLKKKEGFIPIVLLLSSPIAASLVIEQRSTTRALIIVYAYSLLIGLGIYVVLNIKKYSKLALFFVGIVYFGNFSYFAHQYLVHKVYHNPWHSDVGLKEMVQFVNENEDKYSAVVMSHGHYIPYLFYNKVHPEEFVNNSDFAPLAKAGGVKVERFGKIYFNMPYECPPAGKEGTIYVCFGYLVPQKAKLLEVIRFRDQQPAIFFVEFGEEQTEPLPERMEYSKDIDERFDDGVIPEEYESFWPIN
jgi:4-amino-4-deoxy-L-arabinose transferase-like glycosyltransferase